MWNSGNQEYEREEVRIGGNRAIHGVERGSKDRRLTDQRNWDYNGDAYTASQLVFQELPFRMEGYIKLKF